MGDFSHLSDRGEGTMVDVSGKTETSREAFVRGVVVVGTRCAEKLDKVMVREIAATARVAGVMAAKKTSELIPFCHQINLSKVTINVSLEKDRFVIEASTRTRSTTGVEMEAFVGALNAGATVYDMVKAVVPEASIGPFMLVEKKGKDRNMASHKHNHHHEKETFRAGMIVCSDRASQGIYRDESGPAAQEWFIGHGYACTTCLVIPDASDALKSAVKALLDGSCDVVAISGGTGLGRRDLTPQTLSAMCDYEIPGIGEHLRRESLKYSLNSNLSRCGGWVLDQHLVLALPGNPKAVVEQLAMLEDLIPHAIWSLRGECRHRRAES